jgi:hypothetical protein
LCSDRAFVEICDWLWHSQSRDLLIYNLLADTCCSGCVLFFVFQTAADREQSRLNEAWSSKSLLYPCDFRAFERFNGLWVFYDKFDQNFCR